MARRKGGGLQARGSREMATLRNEWLVGKWRRCQGGHRIATVLAVERCLATEKMAVMMHSNNREGNIPAHARPKELAVPGQLVAETRRPR